MLDAISLDEEKSEENHVNTQTWLGQEISYISIVVQVKQTTHKFF